MSASFPCFLTKRFAFDIELLAVAHRMGFRVVEGHRWKLQFQRNIPRLRRSDVWLVLVNTLAIFYRVYLRRH